MTVPFLIDFTPYNLNGQTVSSIDDMVSINLEQVVDRTDIRYDLGSKKNINLPLSIKNITNNTQLRIKLQYDKNMFVINTSDEFLLAPNEVSTISIRLNVDRIDVFSVGDSENTEFSITVENILNGTIVTTSPNVTLLTKQVLSQTIASVI